MGLKWKRRNGRARTIAGGFWVEIWSLSEPRGYRPYYYDLSGGHIETGDFTYRQSAAKGQAARWLRAQAEKMLKDLED